MGRPTLSDAEQNAVKWKRPKGLRFTLVAIALSIIVLVHYHYHGIFESTQESNYPRIPYNAPQLLSRCAEIARKPGVPPYFYSRGASERFVPGTPPVLIHNATIWSGMSEDNTNVEIIRGDILLDRGIIQWVTKHDGMTDSDAQRLYGFTVQTIDVKGAWVTPGLVDIHSHMGVQTSPAAQGADDGNSLKNITQPFLRTLDAINTHDAAFELSIAGGVTSANILPGSADAIGGQAFPFKLRPTSARSASAMLVEQPGASTSTGWRQMKHAVGENPSLIFSGTRMDTIWAMRSVYNEAMILLQKQDAYCTAATSGKWTHLGNFPEDLRYEALVDVLRGKVKVHTHCYEAVDFDAVVRLSNEFNFPLAAFHHAHEAYLVPELLKQAWGKTPAIATFASFARYKIEAFRHSEFAPRILADNGLRVIMKSDHPFPLNSRSLLYEVQQAYYYGLPADIALASVTSTPADVLGLGHRIGYVKEGYDADIVIWDSHPLSLGATPKQVYIDGIAQLSNPYVQDKPVSFQKVPEVPNFDKEAALAVKYDGLPPLWPQQASVQSSQGQIVRFKNVASILRRGKSPEILAANSSGNTTGGVVIVKDGRIACADSQSSCNLDLLSLSSSNSDNVQELDLQGGSIIAGFTTFGSPLGLNEILLEPSTNDGSAFDALTGTVPKILGGDGAVIRASDGLLFGTRNALLAYRAGVTSAITVPDSKGFLAGLGTHFSTGARSRLDKGGIIQDVTSLHVNIGHGISASISTQVAVLRKLLLGGGEGELKDIFTQIGQGTLTLVINVESADIIATLISLKREVERQLGSSLRLTLAGCAEAHLVAKELRNAGIGVILTPVRHWPLTWEQRKFLPGLPLSQYNALSTLLLNNVTVAIGSQPMWPWTARNTMFELAWVALQSGLSQEAALALVTSTLENLLGANVTSSSVGSEDDMDSVAYQGGGLFDFGSKAVAVISPSRESVDIF